MNIQKFVKASVFSLSLLVVPAGLFAMQPNAGGTTTTQTATQPAQPTAEQVAAQKKAEAAKAYLAAIENATKDLNKELASTEQTVKNDALAKFVAAVKAAKQPLDQAEVAGITALADNATVDQAKGYAAVVKADVAKITPAASVVKGKADEEQETPVADEAAKEKAAKLENYKTVVKAEQAKYEAGMKEAKTPEAKKALLTAYQAAVKPVEDELKAVGFEFQEGTTAADIKDEAGVKAYGTAADAKKADANSGTGTEKGFFGKTLDLIKKYPGRTAGIITAGVAVVGGLIGGGVVIAKKLTNNNNEVPADTSKEGKEEETN